MHTVGLALTIARRELRGVKRGLGVFVLCLVMGVGAIAGIGVVSQSVLAGLNAEGAKLLGGDVSLRLHSRPFTEDERAGILETATASSRVITMRAMARPVDDRDRRRLVELKAVDGAYPLYGDMALAPARPLQPLLAERDGVFGAVADPNLYQRLDLNIGDRIQLGEAVLELRGKIVKEPDRVASVMSLGPRLMVATAALDATGLIQPGSRIHYTLRVTFPQPFAYEAWKDGLFDRYPDSGFRVRDAEGSVPAVRRFIDRLRLFLTFVGLTVLLVGGIGVANAVTSYLDQRAGTIATLKCIGASARLIFWAYMAQVLAVAVFGTVLGLVVGALGPVAVLSALGGLLPVPPVIGFYPGPLLVAAAFGLAVSFTFALWPVARAERISPAQLFRDAIAPSTARPARFMLAVMAGALAALSALVFLAADDNYFAAWFIGGAMATFLVLRYAAAGFMALAARARPRRAWLRLALANLHRPGALTLPVTLSLGLGLAVLVTISVIQGNLSRQITERLPDEAPAFFFIDIQPEQVAAFDAAVQAVEGVSKFQRVPSLRGRITAIKGVPVEDAPVDPGSEWAVRGDRALTFATHPSEGSDIVAGGWWPPDYAGPPLISLDSDLARGFGMDLGDTLTLNVLSREITATVTNTREIDWRSLRFDFAIIFSPGVLEGAPFTHIAAVNAPRALEDALERAATDPFPNITAIRVREALESGARILDGVNWAARGMALLSIASGLVVLLGAIAASRQRRIYESVVFKVLGASRGRIAGVFTLEFALIGFATSLIAIVIGLVVSWAVVTFLMQMEWVLLAREAILTAGITLLVAIAIGWFSTWKVLAGRPMPYLRNE